VKNNAARNLPPRFIQSLSLLSILFLAVVLQTGCGSGTGTTSAVTKSGTSAISADTDYNPQIVPADFSTGIDNSLYPLKPGTINVYTGKTSDGEERNEVTVTSDTKVVMGVTCVVVHDKVTLGGKLKEETFDWYAQNKDGSVWYFGEDAKSYENGGSVSTKGSWEAGKNGAKPGIIMKKSPAAGDTWRQEYLKGQAEDMAEVIGLNETATAQAGTFRGCVKTRDWTPLEPAVEENKLYCPETGVVQSTMVKGGTDSMQLVEIRKS